jgi:hypothetical protein
VPEDGIALAKGDMTFGEKTGGDGRIKTIQDYLRNFDD